MSQPEKTVAAGVPDLFFASKIVESGRHAGVRVVLAPTKEALLAAAANGARLAILDLGAAQLDPLGVIRSLKADPATAAIPIAAFANHEHVELIRAARDAGCDQVLTRGAFSSGLPKLLAGLP